MFASKTHNLEVEDLQMLARLNTHENGLRRSPRLREQWKIRLTETQSPYYLWYLGSYNSNTRFVFASSTSHEYKNARAQNQSELYLQREIYEPVSRSKRDLLWKPQ